MRISDFYFVFLVLFLFSCSGNLWGQSKDLPFDRNSIDHGKDLFLNNCNVCHSIAVEKIGPALSTIPKRRPLPWLLNFIKNSQDMIAAGDTHAVFIFERYNNTVMPSFGDLSEKEIKDILAYIQSESRTGVSGEPYLKALTNPIYGDAVIHGQFVFEQQCAVCHAFDKEVIGPALGSTPKTRPLSWLIPFVHNSPEIIKKGDPYANFIYEQYGQYRMPAFTYLSEKDIKDIFLFINAKASGPVHISGANAALNPELMPEVKRVFIPWPSRMSFQEGKEYRRFISLELMEGLFLVGALIHIALIIAMAFGFFKLINRDE